MSEKNIKTNVREFYDRIGWQIVDGELYQNAQYEDLRPVSREYIHRCHLRVNRHLAPEGRYLLDAGSGPVQYPEYLTYSEGYQARICMDISIVALKEARKRLREHGFYVVGDIAHLPFKSDVFDGIVSLHTIHHVSMEDKLPAYNELYRTLNPGKRLVVVNGWTNAPLMARISGFMRFMRRLRGWWQRNIRREKIEVPEQEDNSSSQKQVMTDPTPTATGTYVQKLTAKWLSRALDGRMNYEILVWRSVNVAFLRSVIYPDWGGKFWLKLLFWLEECFPRLLGRIGQYPLVVIEKPNSKQEESEPVTAV
jgi:ubiquinone/menaquinone biosynthesis C-methylase UbiE